MKFHVLPTGESVPKTAGRSSAYLLTDQWDDWFKFSTLYTLVVVAEDGPYEVGGVKIGQFAMTDGQRRPDLPETFSQLDERFFSVGQDASYYEALNGFGGELRDAVLGALRDVALNENLFARAIKEDVTGVSLLRSVAVETVRGQFSRLARGGARLSRYDFSYTTSQEPGLEPATLTFLVEPESLPPTNVHVVIGRNGVGKTYLLDSMARALVEPQVKSTSGGSFQGVGSSARRFASLVSVSFSAFDSFEPLPSKRNKSHGIQYAYVGLKKVGTAADGKLLPPKTPAGLAAEFGRSLLVCRQGARAARWARALQLLESDPIFADAEIASLSSDLSELEDLKTAARSLFKRLSSGHKIVLLTITRLVEMVEERTLVLLDEPEAHLHPPLLSAFVRALSELLVDRNGVAIIATHSPVILQEVPRSCAWILRRTGRRLVAERPEIETFGENVGVLTREVFGLEVSQSGFHRMLAHALSERLEFDEVLEKFNGELGGEARALVRALIAAGSETEE